MSLNPQYYNNVINIDSEISSKITVSVARDGLLFDNPYTESNNNLIVLNSIGGDTEAADEIVNFMNNFSESTSTFCANEASSAASVILASGNKRYAAPECNITMHGTRITLQGQSIEESSAFIKLITKQSNE